MGMPRFVYPCNRWQTLDGFHFWAVMSNVVMGICLPISVWNLYFHFSWETKEWNCWTVYKFMFNSSRPYQTVFQSDYTILFGLFWGRRRISFSILSKLKNKHGSWMRNQFHFKGICNSRYLFWVYKMFHWTKFQKELLKRQPPGEVKLLQLLPDGSFFLWTRSRERNTHDHLFFLLVPSHFPPLQLMSFLRLIWDELSHGEFIVWQLLHSGNCFMNVRLSIRSSQSENPEIVL